ncbi:zinc finger A20 and AN1 domain-containing stress-associated protein 5-like [Dendrobium catenatum]|uniref:zinc finger A20 and AN1 domain-containing stress-associated protein 5-like n=1 Tax=Dendrobium catenatum TaxID=906689 RepID=UPI0009F5E168|nr:zinc finger A20 and AN1 domain-containing stress-associated protein 5-like [Dendrobium catenatum]
MACKPWIRVRFVKSRKEGCFCGKVRRRGSIFLSPLPTFPSFKTLEQQPIFFSSRVLLVADPGRNASSSTNRLECMAQREEETEIRVTETLTLCVNNCGFYGNPATKNMCQSCFQAAHARPPSPLRPTSSAIARSGEIRSAGPAEKGIDAAVGEQAETKVTAAQARVSNRCSGCRRKVGLTGFRCRCGELFCGEHRYSDRHDCSFDYKAAGREAISRENPVVRASKIVKI